MAHILDFRTPGLLWHLFSHNLFFSVWSDLNGMETAIELLFFSLTLAFVFDQFQRDCSARTIVVVNILAGFMVLARLDDIFFLIPLTVLTLSSRSIASRLKLLAATSPFVLVAAYVIYNRITVGRFLPISGTHKASFVLIQQLRKPRAEYASSA